MTEELSGRIVYEDGTLPENMNVGAYNLESNEHGAHVSRRELGSTGDFTMEVWQGYEYAIRLVWPRKSCGVFVGNNRFVASEEHAKRVTDADSGLRILIPNSMCQDSIEGIVVGPGANRADTWQRIDLVAVDTGATIAAGLARQDSSFKVYLPMAVDYLVGLNQGGYLIYLDGEGQLTPDRGAAHPKSFDYGTVVYLELFVPAGNCSAR